MKPWQRQKYSFSEKETKVYSKGPEAKDDDDEVDGVGKEHENVDVCDGAVLWLDQSSEELTDWMVDRQTSGTERERCLQKHRGLAAQEPSTLIPANREDFGSDGKFSDFLQQQIKPAQLLMSGAHTA